jgi:Domain of unknown function (DUF5069)
MKPIDLTTQPPRSPYQKMEGLYMMPRTIDKLRAKLPGGKIGQYSITTIFAPGLSLMLLDDIGVTQECLLEIVQKVSAEHEIADWLRRNADLSIVASLNKKLFRPRIEDVLTLISPTTFNEIYPAAERMAITTPMFEVLLEDDRVMFPNHFHNGPHPHETLKYMQQDYLSQRCQFRNECYLSFYETWFHLSKSTRPHQPDDCLGTPPSESWP